MPIRNARPLRRPTGALALARVGPWPRHITLSEARSRLDRRRSLQVNSHFSAFFKIYKICTILRRSNLKILQKFVKFFVILKTIFKNFKKFEKKKDKLCLKKLDKFLQKFEFRAVQKYANLVDLEKC